MPATRSTCCSPRAQPAVDGAAERARVAEQGRDVAEHDAGLGVAGDGADGGADLAGVTGSIAAFTTAFQWRRHTRVRLLAGMAWSACSSRSCARASASSASKSRTPRLRSRCLRLVELGVARDWCARRHSGTARRRTARRALRRAAPTPRKNAATASHDMMCSVLALNTASAGVDRPGLLRARRAPAVPAGWAFASGCARGASSADAQRSVGCHVSCGRCAAKYTACCPVPLPISSTLRRGRNSVAQDRKDRPLVALAGFGRGQHCTSLRQCAHASHRPAADAPFGALPHRTCAR